MFILYRKILVKTLKKINTINIILHGLVKIIQIYCKTELFNIKFSGNMNLWSKNILHVSLTENI